MLTFPKGIWSIFYETSLVQDFILGHNIYILLATIVKDDQKAPVLTNGPGDLGSIPGCVIPKTLEMVLDTPCFTQQYKVRIKGKVELSSDRSSALPYTSV